MLTKKMQGHPMEVVGFPQPDGFKGPLESFIKGPVSPGVAATQVCCVGTAPSVSSRAQGTLQECDAAVCAVV